MPGWSVVVGHRPVAPGLLVNGRPAVLDWSVVADSCCVVLGSPVDCGRSWTR